MPYWAQVSAWCALLWTPGLARLLAHYLTAHRKDR